MSEAALAVQNAVLRQNISLEVIKQTNDQLALLADTIDQTARSAPVSGTRGTNVNISA